MVELVSLMTYLFVMIVLVTLVWWWAKLRERRRSDETRLRWEKTRRRIAEHNDMLHGRRRSDKLRDRRRRAKAARGVRHTERPFGLEDILYLIAALIIIVAFIVILVGAGIIYAPVWFLIYFLHELSEALSNS